MSNPDLYIDLAREGERLAALALLQCSREEIMHLVRCAHEDMLVCLEISDWPRHTILDRFIQTLLAYTGEKRLVNEDRI